MKPLVKKMRGTAKWLLVLSLCFALCGTLLILPINVFAGDISNGILSLTVQDDPQDTAYGAFMLKKANDGQETLTYAKFFSSYTTVSINGVSYRFSEGEVVTPAYATSSNEVIAVQSFGGVQVTQRLALTTGNSEKEDMLLIHYSTENKTDADVLLSIRVLIDPTLAKSESHMVQINGVPYDKEKTFTGVEVADNWCIKDDSNAIVAYGILNGEGGKPDQFQIADWTHLYDRKSGYQTDSNSEIKDNAVAIIWKNKQLPSGESMDFSTKYGLYSEDPTDDSADEDIPKTGYELRAAAPVILFALSGVCLVAFVAVNRKRRGN